MFPAVYRLDGTLGCTPARRSPTSRRFLIGSFPSLSLVSSGLSAVHVVKLPICCPYGGGSHIASFAITKLPPSTSAPSLTWQPFKLLALQKSAVFFLPAPSSCHPFSQTSHLSTGSNILSVLACLSDKLSGSPQSSSVGRSLAATQERRKEPK